MSNFNIMMLVIASASLSIIVTQSDAFKWLRDKFWVDPFWVKKTPEKFSKTFIFLNKVLNCPLCFGFYAFFICLGISAIPFIGWYVIYALCSALAGWFIWQRS